MFLSKILIIRYTKGGHQKQNLVIWGFRFYGIFDAILTPLPGKGLLTFYWLPSRLAVDQLMSVNMSHCSSQC